MPSLIVPRKGLPLDFGSKPLAADGMIALTLTDDAIENMIKCIREDKDIQLSYGTESVSLASFCGKRETSIVWAD